MGIDPWYSCRGLLEPEGEFCTDVDLRGILGECNVICLLECPLVVTLSTHVTLCTVLTAFFLKCLTMIQKFDLEQRRFGWGYIRS